MPDRPPFDPRFGQPFDRSAEMGPDDLGDLGDLGNLLVEITQRRRGYFTGSTSKARVNWLALARYFSPLRMPQVDTS